MNYMNKELKTYTVKVETLVPALFTYTIKAYSPEEAANPQMLKSQIPKHIQHHDRVHKQKKITVYEYGMSIIKFIKTLF